MAMAIPGDDESLDERETPSEDDFPDSIVSDPVIAEDSGEEMPLDFQSFDLLHGDTETQDVLLDSLPLPLEDWSQDVDLPEVRWDADVTRPVHLDFDAGMEGTLYVLKADYEQTYLSEGRPAVDVRSGWNVYFVPEGDLFPEEYDWAEDGATLYQSETFESAPEDFGGTRLVLRVDSGSYGFLEDGNGELLFDNRAGTPALESNLPIIWA